jgi:hypothetical protein
MARARTNGNGRLEDTMRALAHAQAVFVGNQAETNREIAESRRESAAISRELLELKREIADTNRVNAERFARIEAILIEHSRILRALPDAIREKIDFKSGTSPASPA